MNSTRQISKPLPACLLLTSLGLAALAFLLDSSWRLVANLCIPLAIRMACLTIAPTQEDRDLTDKTNRVCLAVLALTLLLGLIPCGLYGMARLSGELPSEQAWLASNPSHNPWQYDLRASCVLLSMLALLLLAVITVPTGLVLAARLPHRPRTPMRVLVLFGLQLGLLLLVGDRVS